MRPMGPHNLYQEETTTMAKTVMIEKLRCDECSWDNEPGDTRCDSCGAVFEQPIEKKDWLVIVEVTSPDGFRDTTGVFGPFTEGEAEAWTNLAIDLWKPEPGVWFVITQIDDPFKLQSYPKKKANIRRR